MPSVVLQPDLVEIGDFSGGYQPDPDTTAVPENAFIDIENLLPDRGTGVLETRKGYRRFSDFIKEDFNPRGLHVYNIAHGSTNELGKQFLVAQINDGSTSANNVQLHRITVQDGTTARIDDVGREWRGKAQSHWGLTIDNIYFGGSELDPIYSWKPYFPSGVTNVDPWDPDATMRQWAADWATTTAYSVGDRVHDGVWVWMCTEAHTSSDANRPKTGRNTDDYWEPTAKYAALWVDGIDYEVGDIVSYEVTGNQKYPRGLAGRTRNVKSSFMALRDHTSTVGNFPTSGKGQWEAYRGPISNVATYHGSRLWVRDGDAGTSRLRYSAQVDSDGFWDPSDWLSDDIQGAGYIDIRTGDGDDIRSLIELGNLLVICKRRTTHALSGLNPATWSLRQIGDKGCLFHRAACEHEGIGYFFGDQGLFRTDGAMVQEVPGAQNLRDWFRTNVDLETSNIYKICLKPYNGFLWLSFHEGEGSGLPNRTLVYDPTTESFWPQSFGTRQFAVTRLNRIDELFFLSRSEGTKPALVMQYDHASANSQDDIGNTSYVGQDIAWYARTGWLLFGLAKEDRLLRRLWTTVRGASKVFNVKAYKNFSETETWSVTTTASAAAVNWLEGRVIRNLNAISLRVSGTTAPSSFLGWGIHTISRRKRYNRVTQS